MRILSQVLPAVLALAMATAAFGQTPSARVEKLASDFSFDTAASAQQAEALQAATPTDDEGRRFHEYRMQQQKDKVTFAIVLGVVALLANLTALAFLKTYRQSAAHMVSATGLVYIVFGTIILVVIANTEAQLTASMGVLGAIAGYIFGRFKRGDGDDEPATPTPASRDAPPASR